MFLDMAGVAVLLVIANVKFGHFDPQMPLSRRVTKIVVLVAATGVISPYFGRTGVVLALGIASVPVIYIHGIWLPRHGVNGWTGEPPDKYYALRGWNRPQ